MQNPSLENQIEDIVYFRKSILDSEDKIQRELQKNHSTQKARSHSINRNVLRPEDIREISEFTHENITNINSNKQKKGHFDEWEKEYIKNTYLNQYLKQYDKNLKVNQQNKENQSIFRLIPINYTQFPQNSNSKSYRTHQICNPTIQNRIQYEDEHQKTFDHRKEYQSAKQYNKQLYKKYQNRIKQNIQKKYNRMNKSSSKNISFVQSQRKKSNASTTRKPMNTKNQFSFKNILINSHFSPNSTNNTAVGYVGFVKTYETQPKVQKKTQKSAKRHPLCNQISKRIKIKQNSFKILQNKGEIQLSQIYTKEDNDRQQIVKKIVQNPKIIKKFGKIFFEMNRK